MKRLVISVSLIMLLLPAAAWSMGDNLDFEKGFGGDGIATSWAAYGGAVMSGSSIAHGGSWSQKVDAATEGGITQTLKTVAGKRYVVSFWAKVDNGGAWWSLDNGASWMDVAAPAGGDWTKIQTSITATGPSPLILDAWGITYFDDVEAVDITPVAPAPKEIWAETVYWQGAGFYPDCPAGNPMGHAQQLIDGNKTIISEGQGGVLIYGDVQVGGTAFVKSTPHFPYWFSPPYFDEVNQIDHPFGDPAPNGDPNAHWPDNSNYCTKGAALLNGRLYSQDMKCRILQSTLPTWDGALITTNRGTWGDGDGAWHAGMPTGRVESDSYGLLTDGTYLYGSDNPGAFAVGPGYIYKWSVDPAANDGNGALTEVWKVQIPTETWLISIGYYNGKLYAAEGFRGRDIYEIDCATGAYTTIVSGDNLIPLTNGNDAWYMGQIARLGNRLVLADWTGHITQWVLTGGTWKLDSSFDSLQRAGYPQQFYGISLKAGPDGNAKWAWVSGCNIVYFFDLTPYSSKTDLADPYNKWTNEYPAYVGDAVVTAVGADGFWVENKNRTVGAHVLYTPTEAKPMPAKDDVVSIKAKAGKSDSGERTLTASEVTIDGTFADLKPLYTTQRNLGPATGSAGLATDGMLVKVSGKVTGYNYEDLTSFYIDDGSGVANDTPNAATATAVKGIEITKIDTSGFYSTGYDFYGAATGYATVVGIARLQKLPDGTTIVGRIDVRDEAEVVITNL